MANAVLDGTDCVMLSGETANGDYPVDAVTMMSRTCCEAECALNYDNLYQVKEPPPPPFDLPIRWPTDGPTHVPTYRPTSHLPTD